MLAFYRVAVQALGKVAQKTDRIAPGKSTCFIIYHQYITGWRSVVRFNANRDED